MSTRSCSDSPQAAVHAAEIVREFGPFAASNPVHGVSYDGTRVWAATGERLLAIDPATGEVTRTLQHAGDAGTAFDGRHLWQIAGSRIDKIPRRGTCWHRSPRPAAVRTPG